MKVYRFDRLGKRAKTADDVVCIKIHESTDATVLFDVFYGLHNLKKVTIFAKNLVDISVLLKYSITTLEIRSDTVDLEPLCDMESLENLKVNTIDADMLKKFDKLKRLYIYDSCSADILYVLPSCLIGLSLPNKGFKDEIDVDRVNYSETLTSLRVGKGKWKSFIKRFPHIHKLYVNGGSIGDHVLSRLSHLTISHSVLTEFSFLNNYPALKTLYLISVSLPDDITPIWKLPLRDVKLYSCTVKSIAGIDEDALDRLKVVRSHRPNSSRPVNFSVVDCLFRRPAAREEQ